MILDAFRQSRVKKKIENIIVYISNTGKCPVQNNDFIQDELDCNIIIFQEHLKYISDCKENKLANMYVMAYKQVCIKRQAF